MDAGERRFQALGALLDYSKGTLWWVSNRIWNEVIEGFVWKKGNDSHPGLSIAQKKAEAVHDVIPMLIGTSRRRGGRRTTLAVGHISPKGTPHWDSPTFFSPLRPCRVDFDEFGRADGVHENSAKRRLEPDEMQRLDEILASKGG